MTQTRVGPELRAQSRRHATTLVEAEIQCRVPDDCLGQTSKLPETSAVPLKITFVIYSLVLGGAERVLARLAEEFAVSGSACTLITLASRDVDFIHVGAAVHRVALGVTGRSSSPLQAALGNLKGALALRRAIAGSRPDVVLSFLDTTNVLTLIATRGLRLPVVVSERVAPEQMGLPRSWRLLRRLTYRWADALVVQTSDARRSFLDCAPARRTHVIPNWVEPPATQDLARQRRVTGDGPPVVVAMGRLSDQKGFDVLLRAFAACRVNHPQWNLVILGEGPSRGALEELVRELGLSGVEMPGAVADPWGMLRRADIFVLSSNFEGFPNALCEAMARGLPVVSTDCPTGPRDLLNHRENGLLVPIQNVDELARSMSELMDDEDLRSRLGGRARSILDRFGRDRVLGLWTELFEKVRASRRRP